jgi:hypothetical protein
MCVDIYTYIYGYQFWRNPGAISKSFTTTQNLFARATCHPGHLRPCIGYIYLDAPATNEEIIGPNFRCPYDLNVSQWGDFESSDTSMVRATVGTDDV